MVTVAAVGITIPLVRRYDARRAPPKENDVLVRELAEIDGQSAAERLPAAEAEGLKTDTVRRFLAETPPAEPPARAFGPRSLLAFGLGLAAIIAIGGSLLYTRIGRPDLAAAPAAATPPATADAEGADPGHVSTMVAQLEAKMRQNPGDPEGWRMLGWSYMQTGPLRRRRPPPMARPPALDPANADYQSAQGEALVRAADGHVTPDAQCRLRPGCQTATRLILAPATSSPPPRTRAATTPAPWPTGSPCSRARRRAPRGRPRCAASSSASPVSQRGEDVSGEAAAAAAAGARRRPGRRQGRTPPARRARPPTRCAAVQQMAPADQQAMIHNMVDGLAARLKANPNDPDGWVELMRARMVLGDPTAATAAYHDARKALATAPDRLTMVSQAAKQLGVPGA